ncbi:prolyl oligopeptidase family serine peptidase [Paraflavitalea sp. CAU 1676]|uniref:carboxylesterase family protein n=1 Tax=Paraflavitalea sp. CAU 1676 TaxID=3032598 RepID=UPI0023DC0FD6|nr:prolyl oligopeptidase family serine peptidase [Paraflavitalea sp. CAU 1676]MDF2188109.1 prolyl oligopeptidase family serine peptidase [Paraflavitalea sp. CAU 1676]
MKKRTLALAICCIALAEFSTAQEVFFKNGLIANLPSRYGREAVYSDELAYRLYTGTLKTPVAGDTIGTTERNQPIVWMPIEADSTNRLRVRGGNFRGGAPAGPGVTPGAIRGGLGAGGSYIYLTYTSPKAQTALLNIKGNSGVFVNGAQHTGDPYSMGYLNIPVQLKKGLNEFYVRGASAVASLLFPAKPVLVNTDDPTLPFVVPGQQAGVQQGAVVVINTTNKPLKGFLIISNLEGKEVSIGVPEIPALASRKVPFSFDGSNITTKGKYPCKIILTNKGVIKDVNTVNIEAVNPGEQYNSTFTSAIDGSLQYYSVTPQSATPNANSALFLSVHGAGVEAINQARAYKPKDWGTLVAATNRRPRGFNWEDWGRLDALEVLGIAKQRYQPNPQNIYLTGHSMGGHGTWFLGVTYPDQWAAIAPCAGYPTMKGYGSADGLIPDSSGNPLEQLLLRSGNQSDVPKLATNYKAHGVYVFHGDDDRTVPVTYARQMRKQLGEFHPDLSYYEYPGGSHWFGDHSVDWKPLFDFFQWHHRLPDSSVNTIDFSTASPGISATFRWATILQQSNALAYSRIQLRRDKAAGTITGTVENTRLLKLHLKDFATGKAVKITLDGAAAVSYTVQGAQDSIVLQKEGNSWTLAAQPGLQQKGPHRYGTLKDAFNNRMILVYGTAGNAAENAWSLEKALFDAETWYYRGNGAVDIIADKDYSPGKYKDRGVILYGNKSTNSAWKVLLEDCPVQVDRNLVTAGAKRLPGDDHAAYIVWPIKNSNIASVAVIGGTGLKGMQAASANQYFAGASGFPDFMVFNLEMLHSGAGSLEIAGFYDHNWQIDTVNTAYKP